MARHPDWWSVVPAFGDREGHGLGWRLLGPWPCRVLTSRRLRAFGTVPDTARPDAHLHEGCSHRQAGTLLTKGSVGAGAAESARPAGLGRSPWSLPPAPAWGPGLAQGLIWPGWCAGLPTLAPAMVGRWHGLGRESSGGSGHAWVLAYPVHCGWSKRPSWGGCRPEDLTGPIGQALGRRSGHTGRHDHRALCPAQADEVGPLRRTAPARRRPGLDLRVHRLPHREVW